MKHVAATDANIILGIMGRKYDTEDRKTKIMHDEKSGRLEKIFMSSSPFCEAFFDSDTENIPV